MIKYKIKNNFLNMFTIYFVHFFLYFSKYFLNFKTIKLKKGKSIMRYVTKQLPIFAQNRNSLTPE